MMFDTNKKFSLVLCPQSGHEKKMNSLIASRWAVWNLGSAVMSLPFPFFRVISELPDRGRQKSAVICQIRHKQKNFLAKRRHLETLKNIFCLSYGEHWGCGNLIQCGM